MADTIKLNGKVYQLAHDSLVPRGARRWSWTKRPSQPGDPSISQYADWRLDGSQLHSYEDISGGEGYLGIDYTDGTDSRWADIHCLGPEIKHDYDLTTYDGANAPVNANGCALVTVSGITYIYVIRGKVPAKLRASTMALINGGVTLSEAATSVIATRAANGNIQVSFGMDATAYHVITAVGATTDTASANNSTVKRRILAIAPDRVIGAGGTGNVQTVSGNILAGSVDMDACTWGDVATIDGPQLTITGLAVDGNQWVIGTNRGPYLLDSQSGHFFPMIAELGASPDLANCVNMRPWSFLGVIIPLRTGTRWHRGETGRSFGLRTFKRNTSPVQGYTTAVAVDEHRIWTAEYNEIDDLTYIVQWEPPAEGDGYSDRELIPQVIAKLAAGVECHFLEYVGTLDGERTNPLLIGGYDTSIFSTIIGRTAREIDDSNYRFATSGTTYLTELRRYPHMIKDLEAVEFEAASTSTTETITVGFQIDGATAQNLAGHSTDDNGDIINGPVVTDGARRLVFLDDSGKPLTWANGRRIKPQIALASGANTTSPQLQGIFRLYYRLRPVLTDALSFSIVINDAQQMSTRKLQDQLSDEWGGGPVELRDLDGKTFYVRVESVSVTETDKQGNRVASVGVLSWPTL